MKNMVALACIAVVGLSVSGCVRYPSSMVVSAATTMRDAAELAEVCLALCREDPAANAESCDAAAAWLQDITAINAALIERRND